MMYFPAYYGGGGFMPSPNHGQSSQSASFLPIGYSAPTLSRTVSALTPSMYRVACECHAIHGAGFGATLANLLGKVSFAASSNFRIRDRNGRSMPLSVHIQFAGARLSGKSAAHIRLKAPIDVAMKGWRKRWLFDNTTRAALLRKLRGGAIWSMFSMPEGRGYLRSQFSREFQDLSDLYDGNMPSFDRADDDDDKIVAMAPDSVILVICINVQDDAHREWLDKFMKSALASGYLFRMLIMETDELAIEGVGNRQPEVALLEYDCTITELISNGELMLERMSVSELPVLEVSAEAEQILRQAEERFRYMASAALPQRDMTVFAVRLAANTRRIAGCMHVYEGYEGPVSADTMARAVIIAEYFGAQWLATVFPPKPLSESVQRAQQLLDQLYYLARLSGWKTFSWRKADIEVLAPNFGWTKVQMTEAITLICGQGIAMTVPRLENGRRVINLELVTISVPMQSDQKSDSPKN